MTSCKQCKNQFEITDADRAFYNKIDVPEPTWCSRCRMLRRMVFRNLRTVYKRNVIGSDKEVLSCFSPSSPFTVYAQAHWRSDAWDALQYGRAYDFKRPFFEQLKELMLVVPWAEGYNANAINSDYCNNTDSIKNCYLLFNSGFSEDCYYGTEMLHCKTCMDSTNIFECELCYECLDCQQCFECSYSQDCVKCINTHFSFNLINCHDCIGCVNLKHKSYCIFNEQYTAEEYAKRRAELQLHSHAHVLQLQQHMAQFKLQFPHKYMHGQSNEDVSGDYLNYCKNTHESFLSKDLENCKHCELILFVPSHDCYDIAVAGGELCYELEEAGGYNVKFMWWSLPADLASGNLGTSDLEYSMNCGDVSNIFGCVGLKHKQYCIFNKQYTKEEYKKLRAQIIQHMNDMPYVDNQGKEYRYGEFFPTELSPFGYNETLAQEYCPLTKQEALALGYTWRESERRSLTPTIVGDFIPDTIGEVDTSVCQELFECQHKENCMHQCTKVFKIIAQELAFYKKLNIPLPRLCHNCRHYERVQKRNALEMYHRQCMCTLGGHEHTGQCANEFETTYAPERQEKVYCEVCYQRELT